MMKRMFAIVLVLMLGGSAFAQSQQYLSTDGGLFTYETNKHGVVLRSIEPLDAPMIITDDMAPSVEPGEVLYLGRSCDAFSERYGDGNWSWTNGGFIVEFSTVRVAFPGQAVDFVAGNRCRI